MNVLTSQQDKYSTRDGRDRLLLARVATKDRTALTELYGIYQPRLFKFIFRLIHSYDVTDELVNDVMLAVWHGASSYRGTAKVSTWVFGIAYRQSMRRVSKKSIELVSDIDPAEMTAANDTDIEREDWIRAGVRALSPAQQAAVTLVFYLGLTYKEAAEVADCPVNTIKTRMFHARRKLRDFLDTAAQSVDITGKKTNA